MMIFPIEIRTTWMSHAPTTTITVHYSACYILTGFDAPFALTQSALMLTYALRSNTSSTERSPTSSTLTILPLLPLPLMEKVLGGDRATSRVGSLIVVERLIPASVSSKGLNSESQAKRSVLPYGD